MTDPTIALNPNGGFTLHLPSAHSQGQHINIPFTLSGMQVMRRVLRERARGVGKIGNDSSPIQHMVEAWLRRAETEAREKAKAQLETSPLKISADELDLDF